MKPFLALACLALSATAALAQPRPFLYLSHRPLSGGLPQDLQGHASVIVRASYADTDSAVTCADHAKADYDDLSASGLITTGKVAIWVQNFGQPTTNGGPIHNSCFLALEDKLGVLPNPPVDWSPYPGDLSPLLYLQPWMEHGITKATAWMDAFLTRWHDDGGPDPDEMSFDNEISLTGCCDVNYVRILEAMSLEWWRWDHVAVPGSGRLWDNGGVDQTMAVMYAHALSRYGWNNGVWIPMSQLLSPSRSQQTDSDANRPYFTWYERICQSARDAAMGQVYAVVKQHYSACRCGNDSDCNADGAEDDYGWYSGNDPTGVNGWTSIRRGIHGLVDEFTWQGDRTIWADTTEPNGGPRSLWHATAAAASGDFYAPELYPCSSAFYLDSPNGPHSNYYLPPSTSHPISKEDASLFVERRMADGILNSPGSTPAKLAPWVCGLSTFAAQDPDHIMQHTELAKVLAMLRAKNLQEIHIFDEQTTYWDQLMTVMDLVFAPNLDSFAIVYGGIPFPPQTNPDILRYTLRNGGLANEQLVVPALCSPGKGGSAAVRVTFSNMAQFPADAALSLSLECSVQPSDSNIDRVRGLIYLWDPCYRLDENGHCVGDWRRQDGPSLDDYDFNNLYGPGFGFFAPQDSGGWYETRRWFDLDVSHNYIRNDSGHEGTVDVKVVLYTMAGGPCFTAHLDLVQLVGGFRVGSTTLADQVQGADFDYSGTLNADDLTGYFAAWAASSAAADFNNDGVIDMTDLLAYLAAFNR